MTEATEQQKDKITLGLITSWGLGLFCLIWGFVTLFNPLTAPAGFTSLIIAAFLLPPARKFVHQKTGKTISTGVRVICVIVLSLIGSAMVTPHAAAILESPEYASATTDNPFVKAASKGENGLMVQSYALEVGEYGVGKVTGTLRNNSNKEFSYVQVEFNLYDDTGAQVGSTFANINNLEAGGTWHFEGPVLEDRATQAKLKGITSF